MAGVPVLAVSGLKVHYNGHAALEDVTFDLHAGEHVAVVGPNGAGKSALLKAVAGVPTAARALLQVAAACADCGDDYGVLWRGVARTDGTAKALDRIHRMYEKIL